MFAADFYALPAINARPPFAYVKAAARPGCPESAVYTAGKPCDKASFLHRGDQPGQTGYRAIKPAGMSFLLVFGGRQGRALVIGRRRAVRRGFFDTAVSDTYL